MTRLEYVSFIRLNHKQDLHEVDFDANAFMTNNNPSQYKVKLLAIVKRNFKDLEVDGMIVLPKIDT